VLLSALFYVVIILSLTLQGLGLVKILDKSSELVFKHLVTSVDSFQDWDYLLRHRICHSVICFEDSVLFTPIACVSTSRRVCGLRPCSL